VEWVRQLACQARTWRVPEFLPARSPASDLELATQSPSAQLEEKAELLVQGSEKAELLALGLAKAVLLALGLEKVVLLAG
jgi:hypothetical protein